MAKEAAEVFGKYALKVLQDTCFAAGTPVLTPSGEKPIEDFQEGDEILFAPDDAPGMPARTSVVEKLFELSAPTLELRAGGHTVTTTAKHPFFVSEKGWVPAHDLQPGDMLLGLDGRRRSSPSRLPTALRRCIIYESLSTTRTLLGEPPGAFRFGCITSTS